MPKQKITLIANLKAGSLEPGLLDTVTSKLDDAGIDFNLIEIQSLSKKTKKDFGDILVAIGGDGTVNETARLAVSYNRTLAVIPSGTFNHFAKDAGLPLDPGAAINRILKNQTRQVDVATINDRLFINNSVIGFYPHAVAVKDNLRHVIGHRLAAAASAVYALKTLKTYNLEIVADGKKRTLKSRLLLIANNQYDLGQLGLATRDNLESGWLYAYSVAPQAKLQMAKLGLKLLAGQISKSEMDTFRAKRITINTKQNKLRVATDGEVCRLKSPLKYEIRPKALTVVI